jgi:nitroreductase
MDCISAIKTRKSVRNYQEKELDVELVKEIVSA